MPLHFRTITVMLLLCSDRQIIVQETKYSNKIPETPSEFLKIPYELEHSQGKEIQQSFKLRK